MKIQSSVLPRPILFRGEKDKYYKMLQNKYCKVQKTDVFLKILFTSLVKNEYYNMQDCIHTENNEGSLFIISG